VAGTSAGAIIATLYAAGYTPDEMEAIMSKLDQSRLFSRSSRDEPSILSLRRATKVLEEFFGDLTFEKLKLPCAVVAVDIKSAQEVVLQDGGVVNSVLASGAIPAVFPPQKIGEHLLVDGATLDPVPVSVARSFAPALPTVAVVLTPSLGQQRKTPPLRLPSRIPTPIMDRLNQLRLAQAINIFLQATDVGSHMLTELRLKLDAPEVIVRPEVEGIGMLDKVDVHKIIQIGEEAMRAALPELRRATTWPNRMKRKYFLPAAKR
jgi:NTE family protein